MCISTEEEVTPSLDTLPARTECSYNGITLEEGETHCPAPNRTITCHQGELEYSSHCDPVPCSNPIAGVNPCDCPYCPGMLVADRIEHGASCVTIILYAV